MISNDERAPFHPARPVRRAAIAGMMASVLLLVSASASPAAARPAHGEPTESIEILDALESANAGDLSQVEDLLERGRPLPSQAALLQAQRAAALLREDEARAALSRYIESGDADAEHRRHALRLGAASAFFAGRYADAAAHASRLLGTREVLTAGETEGMERLYRIARLLSGEPRQRLETRGSGDPVPTVRDKVGLIRARIATGAGAEEAVLDTGANLSVASSSAARRLGLRMLDGDAAVGNSLGGGVDVRLAIADRLELAGAVLRNVVFLVMDDETLTFPVPGGYRIDAIIGLPVLRALGRVRFGPGDTLRLPQPVADGNEPSNLRVIGSDPYVVASVGGREHPFFFDTGANSSVLSARFVEEHPDLESAPGQEVRRAGAGGMERVRDNSIEQVSIRIGGVTGTAPKLRVETEPAPGEEDRYGVLGADLLRLFRCVTLDFDRMRLEVVR